MATQGAVGLQIKSDSVFCYFQLVVYRTYSNPAPVVWILLSVAVALSLSPPRTVAHVLYEALRQATLLLRRRQAALDRVPRLLPRLPAPRRDDDELPTEDTHTHTRDERERGPND